ncbi:aspartate-alanine antiporter [Variovorax sp. HJSM1_2]|uniref:aspartate-alanine antiporter n=1 Tax=Variovorax sp. HJSM1_2 TaxID=3366263 RepID=UPI003BCD85A5
MLDSFAALLRAHPEIALFICLSAGFAVGAIRFGQFKLGGICGSLLIALLLGQSGVRLPNDLKNIAFGLFIFALGFTGGPQFFANIARGWRVGLLSFVEAIVVTLLALFGVWWFGLDTGTAAGLMAGAATESAVVGTAGEAISKLALSPADIERLQSNVATTYSVTYLFGLVSIVLFTTQVVPWLLKINLREEADKLWENMSGEAQHEPGTSRAAPLVVGRLSRPGALAGATVGSFESKHAHAVSIERIRRAGALLTPDANTRVQAGDELLLVGPRAAVIHAVADVGEEIASDPLGVPMVEQQVILTLKRIHGLSLRQLGERADPQLRRSVWVTRITRAGKELPALPSTTLQRGDVLTLYGAERAVQRAADVIGLRTAPEHKTDFVMLSVGILAGMAIGALSLNVGGANLTLGTGGGCLVAGLLFGWGRAQWPVLGALPSSAAEIIKDFGLATFIVSVGLAAGPDAFKLIAQYGWKLPLMGIAVSLIPACVSLLIGHFLKIETPILLGAIAGQHVSTPAISALVNDAGNSTPMIGYTVTYAISNVLLPLAGPIFVALASTTAG